MFLCLTLIAQLFISRSLQTLTCPVPFFSCSFVLPLVSTSLCGESCANTEVSPVLTLSSLQPMLQPLEVGVHQCSCPNCVSPPQGWGQGGLGNQQKFGSLWEVWEVSVSFSLILLSSSPSTCDFLKGPAQEGLHHAMMAQVTAGLDPIVAEGWDTEHKKRVTWGICFYSCPFPLLPLSIHWQHGTLSPGCSSFDPFAPCLHTLTFSGLIILLCMYCCHHSLV